MFADIEIVFRNKVCKSSLGCRVDLEKLHSFNPLKYTKRENFSGLVCTRFYGGNNITVLIFPNGSVIITGDEDQDVIRSVLAEIAQDVKTLGFSPKTDFELSTVNSVAQFRIRKQIDLAEFSKLVPHSKPDSSKFKAVSWKDQETGCTIRLFRSGAGVVLGARERDQVKKSLLNLYRVLLEKRVVK